MSTQAKPAAAPAPRPLTKDDLKALSSRHRPRFTDEQVIAALQYQRDHNCTLDVAGATQGMTGQTLAARRKALEAKWNVKDDTAKEPAKAKSAKK